MNCRGEMVGRKGKGGEGQERRGRGALHEVGDVARRQCNTLKFVFLQIELNSFNYEFLCTFKPRENNNLY